METNRCFFLHLGFGLKVHPFALEVAFRQLAKHVAASPPGATDEERESYLGVKGEPLQTLNTTGVFVDIYALDAIWPRYAIRAIKTEAVQTFKSM
jgi:hypothetical protein